VLTWRAAGAEAGVVTVTVLFKLVTAEVVAAVDAACLALAVTAFAATAFARATFAAAGALMARDAGWAAAVPAPAAPAETDGV
jgi:hypothetical protein